MEPNDCGNDHLPPNDPMVELCKVRTRGCPAREGLFAVRQQRAKHAGNLVDVHQRVLFGRVLE
jgi:hypothetical protein